MRWSFTSEKWKTRSKKIIDSVVPELQCEALHWRSPGRGLLILRKCANSERVWKVISSPLWAIPKSLCHIDICHMIRLARNASGDLKIFKTPTGKNILWAYGEAIYEIQPQGILNIANKLKTKHIQWQKHKMKVSVATQTLSASGAAAITFLRSTQVKNFMGS